MELLEPDLLKLQAGLKGGEMPMGSGQHFRG